MSTNYLMNIGPCSKDNLEENFNNWLQDILKDMEVDRNVGFDPNEITAHSARKGNNNEELILQLLFIVLIYRFFIICCIITRPMFNNIDYFTCGLEYR